MDGCQYMVTEYVRRSHCLLISPLTGERTKNDTISYIYCGEANGKKDGEIHLLEPNTRAIKHTLEIENKKIGKDYPEWNL